ncbi:hypothetical protein AB0D57_08890 [Streptomyces sp. NPDC048275]|uniref:hypothetical protein n=1 Tax=Streptomyces sp. NPDC048275 TaxID=3155629 RepID=UPI003408AFE1
MATFVVHCAGACGLMAVAIQVTTGVDPLIQDLAVSRSAVSTAYLIGSLWGAFVMPFFGMLMDRFGPRALMAGVALCFGGILIAPSLIAGMDVPHPVDLMRDAGDDRPRTHRPAGRLVPAVASGTGPEGAGPGRWCGKA